MQTGVVNNEWLKMAPHRSWDAKFWIRVSGHMSDRKLDNTLENVRGAITAVEMTEANDIGDARIKRDAAAALVDEARALEAKW